MTKLTKTRTTKRPAKAARQRGRQTKRAAARRFRDRQRRLGRVQSIPGWGLYGPPTRNGKSNYRWGERDKVRARQLIWSNWHVVQRIIEQNRAALRGQTMTIEAIVFAYLTVCKSSLTHNDFTRIEECGSASIIGTWAYGGITFHTAPGSVVRDILTALGLILRTDATWQRRTKDHKGKCQHWIPTKQSWSLPMFANVDVEQLTPALHQSYDQYTAAHDRRQQYADHAEEPAIRGLGDEGDTRAPHYTAITTMTLDESLESIQDVIYDAYDHDEADDDPDADLFCPNEVTTGQIYWGSAAHTLNQYQVQYLEHPFPIYEWDGDSWVEAAPREPNDWTGDSIVRDHEQGIVQDDDHDDQDNCGAAEEWMLYVVDEQHDEQGMTTAAAPRAPGQPAAAVDPVYPVAARELEQKLRAIGTSPAEAQAAAHHYLRTQSHPF